MVLDALRTKQFPQEAGTQVRDIELKKILMKTKFILHGGGLNVKSEDNEKFLYEIINSVNSDRVRILCVYFARPEHRWEESFDEDQAMFLALETEKILETIIAVLDKEKFIEQAKNVDIVFLCGGRKGCLKEFILNLENFRELVDGKVVVGSSAGANILSRYYFSNGDWIIKEGAGILPIKVFCHWSKENHIELSELENYKEKIPLYKIQEGKYEILYF